MHSNRFTLLLVMSFATLLSACSSTGNVPSPSSLPPNPHKARLVLSWSHDVGGGGGNQLLGLAPSVAGGEVFVAAAGGRVAAYKVTNGRLVWQHNVRHARLSGGPAVGAGIVALGTREGNVVALEASNGRPKWRHFVGSPVITSPAIAPGIVAVKTLAGNLIGLDPASGAELWVVSESPPSLTLRYDIHPLIVKGIIYAGFANGKVIAVHALTGKVLWRRQVAVGRGSNPIANLVDVGGVLGYAAGDLYAVTYQGRLAAIDAASGQILWSRKLSSYTGLTLDAARVYVDDTEGRMHAFDLVTGVPDWVYTKLAYRRLSAAVPFGPLVVAGDFWGWLHLLDRSNGRYLGRVRVGDRAIRMPPVVVNHVLMALTNGGTLAAYRLSLRTGKR